MKEKIEEAKVRWQMMQITAETLQETNNQLASKRDTLMEEKIEAEQKREELKTQCKAQDDINAKRL